MDTHPFQPAVLPVTTSALTDVLQTIAALQACPVSCIPSTSTAMLPPSLSFPSPIPSVNLFPITETSPLGLQLDSLPVQTFLSNPSLLQPPSAVEALANALFATTSRRASCPEPPAAVHNFPTTTDTLQLPTTSERRRYSETNLDVLIREQLTHMMPPTAQLPGMPGCYLQHVPAGVHPSSVEQARIAAASLNLSSSQRRSGQRKARTIYGTTQTQQLEDMFRGQMYVVGAERENLALRLGLSPSQVRIWFQNRRSKHRRKQQEEQHGGDLVEKKEEEEEETDE